MDMAKVRTPRGAWVDAALQTLAAGGPDAIRVEALASGLGVSKGGFYWHFENRQALIDEMLGSWEKSTVDDVIARVDGGTEDARAKLRELFELAPSADFAVELALRDWARRDKQVAKRLRRVDSRRLEWLRSLFGEFCPDEDEVEARTMLAYSLMIGSYFVSAKHDGKTHRQILGLAIESLLASK
jgi:AcrR family transcriptional regulator